MKKRLMSTLLMGAFFIASTSMFVSCKDYDDDINANTKLIESYNSQLKEQIAQLNSALQQEKTTATAAHQQYVNDIAKAQAAADAAQTSLAQAIADANSAHATKTELATATADMATITKLNADIATLKAELSNAISSGDATTAANAQSALTAAIDKVNASLDAAKGDIATVTNAQTEIKNTLTSAINTVDTKAGQNASAIEALNTALAGVQQSLQTKEAVQSAIDLAKGEIAANIQSVQAAAEKAQLDATTAKADLATLAEKVSASAAAQAASETKIEALQKAIDSANALEKELQNAISSNASDIAVLKSQIATLDAQIKSVNENLSTLIAANTNTIQDLAGTVGNIDLQVKALEKFCGNLDALNVAGIRDSMRLAFTELKAAKQEAAKNLADAEVRAALTAAGYVAILNETLTARIDSLKDNYATDKELDAALAVATGLMKEYVDNLDVPALQATVDALTEDLGDKSIADILENLNWVNNTLTWSETGEVINLEEKLNNYDGTFAALDEWAADIDQFVTDVKANTAGYQTAVDVQTLIDNAIKDKDGKEKYVALNQINALLGDVAMAEVYKAAGVALSSDLVAYAKVTDLDDYLKISDIDLTKVGASIGEEKAKAIAEKAIEDANLATRQELTDAISNYDAALATALEKLFSAVKPIAENENAAEEANKSAAQVIAEIAEAYEAANGISPAVEYNINVLRIELQKNLTSLVFYPEVYYGGIEAIEITALKITNIYGLTDESVAETAEETYEAIDEDYRGQYDLFPTGYAKYHMNPVTANLKDYTLNFIGHTASTRSEEIPFLEPVEKDGSKYKNKSEVSGYGIYNDILWVEFDNNKEIFNKINNATSIPSMSHNIITYSKTTLSSNNTTRATGTPAATNDDDETVISDNITSHYVYGAGKETGKGIITALTATNENAEGESSYVASDYALIVPVSINRLVLANSKFKSYNEYETSDLTTDAFAEDDTEDYSCMASNKFHLHRKVKERIGDDYAINKLNYQEDFDLTELVETHFVNNAQNGADQKMDDDLFRRLNLAYRFAVIDYTTEVKTEGDEYYEDDQHYTHNSLFITLTDQDEIGGKKYFNGKGYFNQVVADSKNNGKKLIGTDGKPVRANRGSLHRKPVVRVELYSKDDPDIIYAIGYLKLEITEDVEKEAADPFLLTGSDYLFAVCDDNCEDNYNTVTLRWDQIQTHLNTVIENGLSPEEWNKYSVVRGEQYYMDEDDNLQLIDQSYSTAYPYYYLGTASLVDDQDGEEEASGTWTDVLKWKLCGDDYNALYFDLQATGNGIDKKTGIVTKKIVRYFRLTSTDSGSPDLYVGIEIPKNHIRFPAGTIGKVKGAMWKVAATNTNGTDDIVLNVDLIAKTSTDKTGDTGAAKWISDIQPGKFRKEVIKSFFGEKISIDIDYTNLDGTETSGSYLKKAKASFETNSTFQDYYEDAVIYFRMPNSKDEKEGTVYTNNEWVVKGISGNTYTLKVTDLASKKLGDKTIWFNYGASVSVIKVNGVAFDTNNTDVQASIASKLGIAGSKTVRANALNTIVQKVQDGKNGYVEGIRVMAIDIDPKSSTFSQIELLTQLISSKSADDEDAPYGIGAYSTAQNATVKGITQDMLNYAKHNWESPNVESATARPYNMQLTAFMQLVAVDDALLAKPSQMNLDSDEDDDDDYEFASCFVMPGYLQNATPCDYCAADPVSDAENVYTGCFRPFVSNKTFAVRFYQPVFIKNTASGSQTKDAVLVNGTITQDILYSSFLSLEDWTGLKPGPDFTNFVEYYGVRLFPDANANLAYWQTHFNEIAADNESALNSSSPFLTSDKKSLLANAGFSEAKTYAELYNDYLAAKAYLDAVDAGQYPEGTYKGKDLVTTLHEPEASTADGDNGWKPGTTAITGDDNIKAVKDAYEWTANADYERVLNLGDQPSVFATNSTTTNGTTKYTFVYDYNDVLKSGQAAETSPETKPVFWKLNNAGNALEKETTIIFGISETNPLGTSYLDPAIDPTYTQKTRLEDRVGKTAAQLLAADLEYERYNRNKSIFDSYYGSPKLNPDYVAATGDEETDNARTVKQYSMYLDINNQPAGDLDGDFHYTINTVDNKKTVEPQTDEKLTALKGKINYQKIASNCVLGLYYGAVQQYVEDQATALTPAFTTYVTSRDNAEKYHMITRKDGTTTKGAATASGVEYEMYLAYTTLLGDKTALTATDKYKNYKAFADKFVAQFDAAVTVYSEQYTTDEDGNQVTTYNTDSKPNIDTYLAATNGAGMDDDTRTAAQMLKDYIYQICRTDLGQTSGRTIPYLADGKTLDEAKINALPSIYEAAPTDLDFNVVFDAVVFGSTKDGIQGKLQYTYKNVKLSTNETFHIYIPMYVQYYYLNEKAGAPKRVWVSVEVQATSGNDQTARRK